MLIVLKSGNLNLLEPSGPVMGLLYLYLTILHKKAQLKDAAESVEVMNDMPNGCESRDN
jgi:hypothetical protein